MTIPTESFHAVHTLELSAHSAFVFQMEIQTELVLILASTFRALIIVSDGGRLMLIHPGKKPFVLVLERACKFELNYCHEVHKYEPNNCTVRSTSRSLMKNAINVFSIRLFYSLNKKTKNK